MYAMYTKYTLNTLVFCFILTNFDTLRHCWNKQMSLASVLFHAQNLLFSWSSWFTSLGNQFGVWFRSSGINWGNTLIVVSRDTVAKERSCEVQNLSPRVSQHSKRLSEATCLETAHYCSQWSRLWQQPVDTRAEEMELNWQTAAMKDWCFKMSAGTKYVWCHPLTHSKNLIAIAGVNTLSRKSVLVCILTLKLKL